jgi:hypothetical protein
MSRRSRIAVLAGVAALATLAPTASVRAGLPLPQYADMTVTRSGEHAVPMNFAVRVGQPVVLNVYNYSRQYHTFTVPALGVSVLILPAIGSWPRVTTVRFTVPTLRAALSWRCAICPSGNHREPHAMGGRIYVTA